MLPSVSALNMAAPYSPFLHHPLHGFFDAAITTRLTTAEAALFGNPVAHLFKYWSFHPFGINGRRITQPFYGNQSPHILGI